MESVRCVLSKAGTGEADGAVAEALASAASWAFSACTSESRLTILEYEALARVVSDRVAEWLASASYVDSIVERNFDAFFLNGPPASAFRALVDGLDMNPWSADVCARTLLLFISVELSGAQRLARVIEDCGHGAESALVHLPSKIYNVIMSQGGEEHDLVGKPSALMPSLTMSTDRWSESNRALDEYYDTLVEALFIVTDKVGQGSSSGRYSSSKYTTSISPTNAQAVTSMSAVLVKLCVLGKTHLLAKCASEKSNITAEQLSQLAMIAPESAVPSIVRAFASYASKEASAAGHLVLGNALQTVLRSSTTARDFACFQLPFSRPLIPRSLPVLLRFVHAVAGAGAGMIAFEAVAQRWSDKSFSSCSDFNLQQQVTRILLLYMRALFGRSQPKHSMSSWMIVLASGVSARLSSSVARVRRHGMLVGEFVSSLQRETKPLRFPRPRKADLVGDASESDNDSDLSDIASMDMSRAYLVEEDFKRVESKEGSNGIGEEHNEINGAYDTPPHDQQMDASMTMPHDRKWSEPSEERRENPGSRKFWWHDDDWSSLESFAMSSDDEDFGGRRAQKSSQLDGHASDSIIDRQHVTQRILPNLEVREQDYFAVKKAVSAPLSVGRILAMIRKLNGGDHDLTCQPDLIVSTLRTLRARALALRNQSHNIDKFPSDKGMLFRTDAQLSAHAELAVSGATLKTSACEMTLAVLHIECDRFPESEEENIRIAREGALMALVALDLERVGRMLIDDVFCGKTADVSRREEALSILCKAIRLITTNDTKLIHNSEETDQNRSSKGDKENGSGFVTRYSRASIDAGKSREEMKYRKIRIDTFSRIAVVLFYSIANGLDTGRENSMAADFIVLTERDSFLAAQGIATLGFILSNTGAQCAGRDEMCMAMIEICCAYRLSSDVRVRRAVALALGSAARMASARWVSLTSGDVGSTTLGSGTVHICTDWLRDISNGADADVYARRFAANALHEWASKLDEASRT